ncbi:hypothetical protein HPE56_15305 [Maribacter sp. ANRC-HE7]|uniref:Uncharacterized protein n=1 Tax=Maribacter aquimaris TaxID=2737171 RepID=A0ABR7V793_9FLAO|nr:hypothetical protein [Maribacter aquimaris]MBD0779166.1 hypothetical protein [Maribacter aquimaris]
MKLNKIIGFSVGMFALLFIACEPIVTDTEELYNVTDVAGVELMATQIDPGGNKVALSMVTPGITGYWDYNTGQAYTDKVEFVYPILGAATFTYHGTLGAEFFSKTIDVTIDEFTTPIAQDYYDLTGEDPSIGKTWVFNGTPDDGLFYYMSPSNNIDSWAQVWWNAGECCAPDPFGSMTFDLNGAANVTYYNKPGAEAVNGTFNLDVSGQTLTFTDPTTALGYNANWTSVNGVYQIVSLTEDELILYVPLNVNEGGDPTGWTLIYKPQE